MGTKHRVRVTLNGSNQNPYEQYGLTANPFRRMANPDLANWATDMLVDLESRPIKDVTDLIQRLERCEPEFRDLCVARFVPGSRVTFHVSWED